jgi:epoxyqueuosine reductase QueG
MFLRMLGHEAVPVASNFFYRPDVPGGRLAEKPDISHRYLAVRAGIGHFGLSGNIINKEIAAPLILGSCVTTADLFPTDPLPAEDNYCDSCKLCMSACASGLMSDTEDTTVTMGGIEFTYSMRRTYTRCDYVCGGFTGLHPSGKWSTWSPARFPIPETDEEFQPALINAVRPYVMRPKQGEGFFHALMPNNRAEFTCGHCQLLCHPDKEVRKKRYKMITSNGVVVQDADGRLKAVTPDEAKRHLEAMDTETRALYE